MEYPYNYSITEKPTRSTMEFATGLSTYSTEPRAQAYYDIRGLVNDFLEEQQLAKPPADPTKRSNVLYYYRQALRFGDKEKARKFWNEYRELGGTTRTMIQSSRAYHPLNGIPSKYCMKFMRTLTPEDKEKLHRAKEWWRMNF